MNSDGSSEDSPQAEALRKLFSRQIENTSPEAEVDVEVVKVAIVTDEKTNEEFLEVALAASALDADDPMAVWQSAAAPLVSTYAELVKHGFDYPLETVVYLAAPSFPTLPGLAFRASVMWVREHIHGNYTLEQLLSLVYDTIHGPENIEDARDDWVPEFDPDWRNVDDPDEIGAGVSFEHWTSGKDYPMEDVDS